MDQSGQEPPYPSLPPARKPFTQPTETKASSKITYSYPSYTTTVSESMTLVYGSDIEEDEFLGQDIEELPEHDVIIQSQPTCIAVSDMQTRRSSGHKVSQKTRQEKSQEEPVSQSSGISKHSSDRSSKHAAVARKKDSRKDAAASQHRDCATSSKQKSSTLSKSKLKHKLKQKSNTSRRSLRGQGATVGSEQVVTQEAPVAQKGYGREVSSDPTVASHDSFFSIAIKTSTSCPSPEPLWPCSEQEIALKYPSGQQQDAELYQQSHSSGIVQDEAYLQPMSGSDPSCRMSERGQFEDGGETEPVDARIERIQKQLDNIYEKMEQFHNLYQTENIAASNTFDGESQHDIRSAADGDREDLEALRALDPDFSSFNFDSTHATKGSTSQSESALVAGLTTDNSGSRVMEDGGTSQNEDWTGQAASGSGSEKCCDKSVSTVAYGAKGEHVNWTNQIVADIEAKQRLACVTRMLRTCIEGDWDEVTGFLSSDKETGASQTVQLPASSGNEPSALAGYHFAGASTLSDVHSSQVPPPSHWSSSRMLQADHEEGAKPLWQVDAPKPVATKLFLSPGLDARVSTFTESPPDEVAHSTPTVHPQFVDISPVLSTLSSPKLSDIDATMTSIDIVRDPYRSIFESASPQKITMTVDKDGRPMSPVHVHVDDQTSVHVHVKKPKKSCLGDHGETKRRSTSVHGASNLRRTGASARARSKSPLNGPWVPPPGKTTKASSLYSWQGQSHRLEIVPHDDTAVRGSKMYELSTDEEDEVTNKMKKYERKIDELMNEVGTLRNEMALEHSARELCYKDDMLQSTNCALLEKEAEIEDYRRELLKMEHENRALRQNMGHMQNEAVLNKSEREQLNSDRDLLMKKLVEVEMDGQAAAKQVAALRDSMQRLRQEKQLSSTDSQMLNKQKELLLERLMEFELTNRSLRRMLRERHEEEANSMRLREQRDLLLLKLRETEDAVQRLRTEVLDKSRQIADQRIQMTAQQEETMNISNKQVSLESTRAHLQKQLRQKEADCNRMAVQIRTLESKLAQERIEIDHLQGQVEMAREKADRDKEALKKAARVQKHRAAHSEEAVEHANAKLMERDAMMADMRAQIDGLMTCLDKISKEKSQALAENSAFKTRINELEGILTRLEDDTKNKVENATAQLHERTTEVAAAKLENERLKTTLSAVEGKLQLGENEVAQLRNNLTEYERLVEEYRAQTQSFMSRSQQLRSGSSSMVTRMQHQADDSSNELEQQRRETAKVQQASNDELDKVKSRLQVRLQELEPIPEMLRSTELQLQEATEKLHSHEARNRESSSLLEELTTKLEIQTKDMDAVREKWLSSQTEVRTLKQNQETLEKKLRELEDQNREIMCTIAKKEEAVHQSNMRMDEQSRENASLTRQLETALCDARRLSETARDKISCRDRITQQRILDLEAHVNQLRTEVTRAKREKEEAERKFNSRLYDLKDRLEQAHSTNRSMQNYVQFLKNSYSNVFGDSPLMTTSSPFKTFH